MGVRVGLEEKRLSPLIGDVRCVAFTLEGFDTLSILFEDSPQQPRGFSRTSLGISARSQTLAAIFWGLRFPCLFVSCSFKA